MPAADREAEPGFIGKDAFYLSKQIDGLQHAIEATNARIDDNHKDISARIDGIDEKVDRKLGRVLAAVLGVGGTIISGLLFIILAR